VTSNVHGASLAPGDGRAIHEAAHTVVAAAMGCAPVIVTIEGDQQSGTAGGTLLRKGGWPVGGRAGFRPAGTSWRDEFAAGVSTLAGAVADLQLAGHEPEVVRQRASGDYETAVPFVEAVAAALRTSYADARLKLWAHAWDTVKANAGAIRDLAAVLERCRTLRAAQLDEILAELRPRATLIPCYECKCGTCLTCDVVTYRGRAHVCAEYPH
jgi:hypothetical protein